MDRKILKVFCPVCDEPFKQESLLLDHLEQTHDVMLGSMGDRPKTADGKGDDEKEDDGWVVMEAQEEQEPEVQVSELSRWSTGAVLQSGCPPRELLRPLLLSLTGAAGELQRRGGLVWFEQCFAAAFPNGTLPSEFFQLPLFGSTVDAATLSVQQKRLLCVLAHHFPECNFCPVLVSLLQLALEAARLSEEEALALLFLLLRQKEKALRRAERRQVLSLVATSKSQARLASFRRKGLLTDPFFCECRCSCWRRRCTSWCLPT